MKVSFIQSLFLFICLSIGFNANSQELGINFFQGNWEEALNSASDNNQLIYLDCYTSWCGPCKKMEANVFTQADVAAFYNKTFVNYRMDMESDLGKELAKKYGVSVYPTHLYLDENGEILHRSTGYKIASSFIHLAEKALDPKKRTALLETKYQEGNREASFMKKYLHYLKKTKQPYQDVFDAYLPMLSDLEPSSHIGLLRKYTFSVQSEAFQLFMEEEEAISEASSKAEFDFLLRQIVENSIYAAASTKDKQLYQKAQAIYKEAFPDDSPENLRQLTLKYLKSSGQYGLYYDSLKRHIEQAWLHGKSMEEMQQDMMKYPDSSFFIETNDEMIIAYFAEKGEGTLDIGDWTKEDGLVAIEYYNGTAGFITNYALQFLKVPDANHDLLPKVMNWVDLALLIEEKYTEEFSGKFFYYEAYAKLAYKNQQLELAKSYTEKAISFAKDRKFPDEDYEDVVALLKKTGN